MKSKKIVKEIDYKTLTSISAQSQARSLERDMKFALK